MDRAKVGVIGCGSVSDAYFTGMKRFDVLDVVACADLIMERAREKAAAHEVLKPCSTEELINDPGIEIVVNLTIPEAHYAMTSAALEAGKHVYSEKALAVNCDEGRQILELARKKNRRVGCAPDTFFGGGLQTCMKLMRDGWLGEPLACSTTMMMPGTETFHPDPEYTYQPGAGPIFDFAPYYFTALVLLLGPVKAVSAVARTSFPQRTILAGDKRGETFEVNTPTHIEGILEFAAGAVGHFVFSYDVWERYNPKTTVYGTLGTLGVPDANTFGGPVQFRPPCGPFETEEWQTVPLTHGYAVEPNYRGIGVADLALAIREGRPHRASAEQAYHVLEVMAGTLEAAEKKTRVVVESAFDPPAPLSMDHRDGNRRTTFQLY